METLAQLWPTEHVQPLKIALRCEGSAFQRVSGLGPKVLKVSILKGEMAIVKTLGARGKSRPEGKFDRFDRAIFGATQRPDEMRESYLARHDH